MTANDVVPPDGHRILTIQEVSQFLRIPLSTIYLLAKKGQLPGIKLGRHWRFLESDILDYFHRVRPHV